MDTQTKSIPKNTAVPHLSASDINAAKNKQIYGSIIQNRWLGGGVTGLAALLISSRFTDNKLWIAAWTIVSGATAFFLINPVAIAGAAIEKGATNVQHPELTYKYTNTSHYILPSEAYKSFYSSLLTPKVANSVNWSAGDLELMNKASNAGMAIMLKSEKLNDFQAWADKISADNPTLKIDGYTKRKDLLSIPFALNNNIPF